MVKKFLNWAKANVVFLASMLGLSAIFYCGFTELNQLPIGMHYWKQTLHFSMIQNFADGSATFWHPAINNLFNSNHTGSLILEFPVFHEITALLIRLFPGLSPVLFRWIMFVLTLIGFYHIYKLGLLILKEKSLAVLSTLLVFVIPIIVYYGANYLVDVPAMAFAFSTIYFLEKNKIDKSWWNIAAAAGFLFLAGSLRLPVLIPFLSYAAIRLLYQKRALDLLFMLPSLILIYLWYSYVKEFNTYWVAYPPFITYGYVTPELAANVKDLFIKFMVPQFGWGYRFWAFYAIVFVFLAIRWKDVSRFWFSVLCINIIGSGLYFYLWFGLFNHHDYYLIPVVSNAVLIWFNVFFAIRKFKFRKVVVGLSIILLMVNVLNTFNNERRRTHKPAVKMLNTLAADFEGVFDYYTVEDSNRFVTVRKISPYAGSSFLFDNGIQTNDTVICDFDPSPSYSLSLLQLKGWTLYNSEYKTIEDYTKFVNAGAKYLICSTAVPSNLDSTSQIMVKSDRVFKMDNLECYNIVHLKADSLK